MLDFGYSESSPSFYIDLEGFRSTRNHFMLLSFPKASPLFRSRWLLGWTFLNALVEARCSIWLTSVWFVQIELLRTTYIIPLSNCAAPSSLPLVVGAAAIDSGEGEPLPKFISYQFKCTYLHVPLVLWTPLQIPPAYARHHQIPPASRQYSRPFNC